MWTLELIQTHWLNDYDGDELLKIRYKAIHDRTVMAVAVVDLYSNLWRVYIAGVLGQNHDLEWLDVRRHGAKVPEALGSLLFPDMPKELQYCEE